MSRKTEKVVYRGILAQFHFCQFREKSFSTATPGYNS
jgi:hypothetical protein